MHKIITTLALALVSFAANAQVSGNASGATTKQVISNVVLDANEDPDDFISVADLMQRHEQAAESARRTMHFKKVWKRRGYFNLGYITGGELTPQSNNYKNINAPRAASPDLGINGELGTSWSLANRGEEAWGENYWANMFLDLTMLNLQYAKYGAVPGEGGMAYDSGIQHDGKPCLYWNMPKTMIDYSLMIGPRLVFAPFTWIKKKEWQWAHETHLNVYGQIGYQVGIVNFKEDKAMAVGQNLSGISETRAYNHGPAVKFGVAIDLAHGWGLGMERKMVFPNYKAIDTEAFGNDVLTFDGQMTRVYLYYRFTTFSRLGKVLNR